MVLTGWSDFVYHDITSCGCCFPHTGATPRPFHQLLSEKAAEDLNQPNN